MPNQDLVSIILSTFKCRYFIEKSIKSAQTQSYQKCELIVVDDCSQTDTFYRASRYERQIQGYGKDAVGKKYGFSKIKEIFDDDND